MKRIAFIGLGNMGMPMALNLIRAGHEVRGFDISEAAMAGFAEHGGNHIAPSPQQSTVRRLSFPSLETPMT